MEHYLTRGLENRPIEVDHWRRYRRINRIELMVSGTVTLVMGIGVLNMLSEGMPLSVVAMWSTVPAIAAVWATLAYRSHVGEEAAILSHGIMVDVPSPSMAMDVDDHAHDDATEVIDHFDVLTPQAKATIANDNDLADEFDALVGT